MPDLWFLTPAEQKRVRAYDERTRQEMEAERAPAMPQDTMHEWREAMEESRMDCLRELQEDIAAMIRVRERWPGIPEIRDRASLLITLDRYEIDQLRGEIQNARR